jgi:hypothetical protein
MPLFRWAANYFSCPADEASHHIDYVSVRDGKESLRGTVRYMQNTYYIHFNLRARVIAMQHINLDGVAEEDCPTHPSDLVVTDPLTLYCVVEFIKMWNVSVWAKVPLEVAILYPSEIAARDLGSYTDRGFGDTMQNTHWLYAPLMFALLKRCPKVARAGRVDAIIRVQHGDIDLGTIALKDRGDTLTFNGASFFVWARRHFRLMGEKCDVYYKVVDDYDALHHPDESSGQDSDDSDDGDSGGQDSGIQNLQIKGAPAAPSIAASSAAADSM